MFDRRLSSLQQTTQVNGGQQPPSDLGELKVRPMPLGIACRTGSLNTGGRRDGPEAAAEVKTDVCLRLAPPSEGSSPPVGV
jgi:hypothetical protein